MTPIFRSCVFGFAIAAMVGTSAAGAPAGGLAGSWQAEQANSDGSAPLTATLVFTRRGAAVSGVMRAKDGEVPLFDVKEAGNGVSFTVVIPGSPYVSVHYSGALTGDDLRLVSSNEG